MSSNIRVNKVLFIAITIFALSLLAQAQTPSKSPPAKRTPTRAGRVVRKPPVAAPVPVAAATPVAPAKKRTPSMTAEGSGQVFKSASEIAREERDARWKESRDAQDAASEQAEKELDDELYALQEKILSRNPTHHKARRRASPFKLGRR